MYVLDSDRINHVYETNKHKYEVNNNMITLIEELQKRAISHDNSKLEEPEASIYAVNTSKLSKLTYGSDEYKECLKDMKPAIDHHYEVNPHHPEHYKDGINGMDLVDMVEMICDWAAACKRHNDGDILKSIEINQKRFGYSDDIKQILLNTVCRFLKE